MQSTFLHYQTWKWLVLEVFIASNLKSYSGYEWNMNFEFLIKQGSLSVSVIYQVEFYSRICRSLCFQRHHFNELQYPTLTLVLNTHTYKLVFGSLIIV